MPLQVKIWGLDYGDCHKSFFAHEDSVMSVAFLAKTHYFFTAGKDRVIKVRGSGWWRPPTQRRLVAVTSCGACGCRHA